MVKGKENYSDIFPPKTVDISVFKIKGVIKGDECCDKKKANQVKFRIEICLVKILEIAQYFFHRLKFNIFCNYNVKWP